MSTNTSRALMSLATCGALLGPGIALATQDAQPQTHEFLVTIVAARTGAQSMPDLPQPTVAALSDLSSLLPYNNFTVVDAGWMRTVRDARMQLGEAGSFQIELAVLGGQESADQQLMVQLAVDHRDHIREEDGRIRYPWEATNLLASTFGILPGETVVVGTSRLNGDDEALIVLLHVSG